MLQGVWLYVWKLYEPIFRTCIYCTLYELRILSHDPEHSSFIVVAEVFLNLLDDGSVDSKVSRCHLYCFANWQVVDKRAQDLHKVLSKPHFKIIWIELELLESLDLFRFAVKSQCKCFAIRLDQDVARGGVPS